MHQINSVLLVDDDPASSYLGQFLLKKLNKLQHIVLKANGKEALDFLKETCGQSVFPDLILLDINMPLMDGFEFMEHFRLLSVSKPVRVVLLSSSVSSKDMQAAESFRIKDFINKPLTKEKLAQLIEG
ncbi:response regulator [Pontibacter brevis]